MKTALITGASSGLGAEFAKLFARDGHSVVLVARRRALLESLAQELRASFPGVRAHAIELDLGVPGAGAALLRQVSALKVSVDFLVNNAGFGSSGPFSEQALAKELQMTDLNVRALLELSHLVLPGMISRKSGRILNVGSTAGFQPGPYMATYYATNFNISFPVAKLSEWDESNSPISNSID